MPKNKRGGISNSPLFVPGSAFDIATQERTKRDKILADNANKESFLLPLLPPIEPTSREIAARRLRDQLTSSTSTILPKVLVPVSSLHSQVLDSLAQNVSTDVNSPKSKIIARFFYIQNAKEMVEEYRNIVELRRGIVNINKRVINDEIAEGHINIKSCDQSMIDLLDHISSSFKKFNDAIDVYYSSELESRGGDRGRKKDPLIGKDTPSSSLKPVGCAPSFLLPLPQIPRGRK